ncbi:sugar dehydrogenase complex small subunit [Pelagibius sp.]|uniref:sugar dehydrogenase complex small subunit n=1 Tax=Pelagibius sp. TaxID=1931238 RepID=UPI00260DFEDF|nr:sugar dehydrogenase complex small subunit [Pelagibius sp.]
MLSRRRVLEGTVAISAGCVLPGLSAGATELAAARPDRAVFLGLSRALTGFDDLNEELAAHFMTYLAERDPERWRALMSRLRTLDASGDAHAGPATIKALEASEDLWALAKEITGLWYSGWTQAGDEVPQAIRAEGYREALAWRVLALTPRGVAPGRLWQQAED